MIAATSRSSRRPGSLTVACASIATAALSALVMSAAHAQIIRDVWVPNGPVYAVAPSGNTIYFGGTFTSVGPPSGNGVPLSAATGTAAGPYAKVAGTVRVAVSDGAGGWYVAGAIGRVGGVVRGLAHVLADGSLSPWDPNPDGLVNCLAVTGSTVYVGGYITNLGGQPRLGLGAVDAVTGAATSWIPNSGGIVYALAVSGSTVYAGGGFNSMGGQTRHNIAAIDAATGAVTAWNPNANNAVRALAVSGSTVYAGGVFTTIGGLSRTRIAALDAATGAATAWNPGAISGIVHALALSGSTVYAGGDFTASGGQARNRIVALDAATGAATAWNPDANATVYTVAVDGSTVYAGGDFTSVGGLARNHIAALDASGNATAWNPNMNGAVLAIASNGSTVYAGGEFTSMGSWLARNSLAALDATTGAATAWDPGATGGAGSVHALAVSGSTVYVGGEFTVAGGLPRNRIAALDASTGAATAWNPNASGTVYSLALGASTVYAGGEYSSIGGQMRSSLAELNVSTGLATSWNPNVLRVGVPGLVYALQVAGPTIYAGGNFNTVGGQAHDCLAALDVATAAAAPWNASADEAIASLAVDGTTVYVGGSFQNVGGQARSYLAAVDATSGAVTSWNPGADANVNAVALSGSTLYAGGNFVTVGGQGRPGMASLDLSTGAATDWNPNAGVFAYALAVDPSTVYAGGGSDQGFLFVLSQSTVSVPEARTPPRLELAQNRPNPAGSSTVIEFTLPAAAPVTLSVYDLQGRRVASLLDGAMRPAGVNRVPFRAAGLASGMYLYKVEALGRSATRKMIVVE